MPDLKEQLQASLGANYRLDRELGGGGMSRVFLATDLVLDRQIVVKVLPLETRTGVSHERFRREIQVAARLQHPHIVPLLSAGETDGLPFFTMPFVKGESLRARLSRGGELSVNESVHLLRDVASALAYAHAEGIVHRDIKPDNVIVSGGVGVVTDFGVAKAVNVASTQESAAAGLTSLGIALGTPAYMAPEQASADPHVDQRADIYSFGCLAYELLSGASPFAGRPAQQMLAAHVTENPEPLSKRRPAVPPALNALVMKCLEKRAGDRPQTAEELLAALDAIVTPSGGIAPTDARLAAVRQDRTRWVPAIVAAVLILAVSGWMWTHRASPALAIAGTTPVAVSADLELEPAISPDGKLVAYTVIDHLGHGRIFVKQIDGGRPNLLSGDLATARYPQWSPDGSHVSFAAGPPAGLYVVPALGGAAKRSNLTAIEHSWTPDGKQVVFSNDGGIWIADSAGTNVRNIVRGQFLHSPAVSPDGHLVAFADGRTPSMQNVSTNAVWVAGLNGATPVRVSDSTHVNISPVWAPDGKNLFFVSNMGGVRDVYQQPVNSSGHATGAAERLSTNLSPFHISLSADGKRMAYDVVRAHDNIWSAPIPASGPVSFGSARQVTRETEHIESLTLSHDGKWLAYDSDRGGNFDIYKVPVDGGDPIQLTTNPGNDFAPGWSPDDREIAFHSSRTGTRNVFVVGADGSGERQVTHDTLEDYRPRWSPDGRQLVYTTDKPPATFIVTRDKTGSWSPPAMVARTDDSKYSGWLADGSVAYISAGLVHVKSPAGVDRVAVDSATMRVRPQSAFGSRDGSSIFVAASDPRVGWLFESIPKAGGKPRVLLAEDSLHRFGRWEFDTDGKRIYFTLATWEADVWVMDFKR